jgi:hypothetical protein
MGQTGWVYEVVCEIKVTWLGSERREAGNWMDLANMRAPIEWNGCRKV